MKNKLIVDIFAGGGGVSTGIFQATGRHPDIAINHNDDALSMHRANHPHTRHFIADVYEVCPKGATQGRPVGWLHISPDCTHHSQAAGGQPRSKKLRGLAWVGYRWAGQVLPDVISLENVTQILKWGPLVAKRDKTTGRVIKLDGSVSAPGERVPVQQQHLIPDRKRAGQTWQRFCSALRALGYTVEDKTLCAADFGAPTTRERLFMIARRDGQPIQWPIPTHFKAPVKGQKKWRSAAECIDFTFPINSIFERKKPLADATMRRIAKGLSRYVLESADPFIVPIAHYNGSVTAHSIAEPLRTITSATKGGEFALAAPTLIQAGHGDGKQSGVKRWGTGEKDIKSPMGTVTGSGGFALSVNHLVQLRNHCDGRDITDPIKTISAGGEHHGLVSAFISSYYTDESNRSRSMHDPVATITTENRLGLIECTLSNEHQEGALRVAAFLMRYYSEGGQTGSITEPIPTITTKDRMALVTVMIRNQPHVIVDIGLRMLQPIELFRGNGFPITYRIEYGHDGRKFTKEKQVRMCGNSVPPDLMEAVCRANYPQPSEKIEQDAA